MAKYIFLIRSPEQFEPLAFRSEVFDRLVPQLLRLNPEKLKIDLTEVSPPRLAVVPFRRSALAMISVWDNLADRSKQWQAEMAAIGSNVAGYEVTESTPVAYKKDWDDGKASPGAVMLTLMRKNPSLSHEQFMEEWFGHHTPMAMRIHPLWNYIRNVVETAVVEGSPPMDGIVEEHCRSLRDITNPARYFGGPLSMLPNMVRVGLHASKFLQLSAVENYLVTEYHIRG
jgi:hypothetical protein